MGVRVKLIKRWLRYWFTKNEVEKGRVLVIWKDVDKSVYGWTCDASNEQVVMSRMAFFMKNIKRKKLERITGMAKKDGDGNILYPFEDEDDSPSPPY